MKHLISHDGGRRVLWDVRDGSVKGKSTTGSLKFAFKSKSSSGAGTPSFPATGKFSITESGKFFKGKVQCLEVGKGASGWNAANLGGTITESNISSSVGEFFDINAFDSGKSNGKEHKITADPDGTTTCQTPTTVGTTIDSGNIAVQAKTA